MCCIPVEIVEKTKAGVTNHALINPFLAHKANGIKNLYVKYSVFIKSRYKPITKRYN